jgi:hypothetical protein
MVFLTWDHSHSNVTANPSTEIKETWGLPHMPSSLSALLKYTLQKISYVIATRQNPEFISLFAAPAPKTRFGAPAEAGLWQMLL